jgi:flagellar biosynthesis component FlhA
MDPGTVTNPVEGQPTTEPAFGLPALWIHPSAKDIAAASGYTVVDPLTVLITHLSEIFKRYAPDLLSRQDVQALLDKVKTQAPALVNGVVPEQITLGEVHKVLRMLLRERVCIRDMVTILEALSDAAAITRDPVQLYRARKNRSRQNHNRTAQGNPTGSFTPFWSTRKWNALYSTTSATPTPEWFPLRTRVSSSGWRRRQAASWSRLRHWERKP